MNSLLTSMTCRGRRLCVVQMHEEQSNSPPRHSLQRNMPGHSLQLTQQELLAAEPRPSRRNVSSRYSCRYFFQTDKGATLPKCLSRLLITTVPYFTYCASVTLLSSGRNHSNPQDLVVDATRWWVVINARHIAVGERGCCRSQRVHEGRIPNPSSSGFDLLASTISRLLYVLAVVCV